MAWIQVAVGFILVSWGMAMSTRRDVATGRRERMALYDDYGSNRGWHWPWSPMALFGFLLLLTCPVTAIMGG